MPAYVIGEADIVNPYAMKGYGPMVVAAVKKYGGKYLARGARPQVLEGGPAHNILIIEFENAARRAPLVRLARVSGRQGGAAGQFQPAAAAGRGFR